MNKKLVTIQRDEIDLNDIHGFVINESKELIMIQYVYDFKLDGIIVLSKNDITEIKSTKTDIFQTQLLKDEGIFGSVNFKCFYNLENWQNFLLSVEKKHQFVICEEEKLETPGFSIGRILNIGQNSFSMEHFSGTAKWHKEPISIDYKNLTSCQIGSNYLNVYENYFKRKNA